MTQIPSLILALIDIGVAAFVVVLLWIVLHYRNKALETKMDRVIEEIEKVNNSIGKLEEAHHGLAREFSELRGEVKATTGYQGATLPPFSPEFGSMGGRRTTQ